MDKEAKKALFNELYQLDDEESGEEDLSNASAVLSRSKLAPPWSRSQAGTLRNSLIHSSRSDQLPLGRTFSAPLPELRTTPAGRTGSTSSLSFSSIMSASSQKRPVIDTSFGAQQPTSIPTYRNMPNTHGKRKRGQSFEARPESQQLFKGLSFFFLPNDDVAPPRKLRIRKAMEFGALWVREWRDDITHLVADKSIPYNDILRFLKISSLPSGIILVNDVYPSDCLTYGFLVNPNQPYYQVKGQEVTLIAQNSSNLVISSNISLQLKPEKEEPPQQTPSRTETNEKALSSQLENDACAMTALTSTGTMLRLPEHTQSALDEAIEETKAIRDLPLDSDGEDDESPKSSDSMEASEAEHSDDERKSEWQATKGPFNKPWQQDFTCMSKHDGAGKSENPNARTIEVLQLMATYYESQHDHWRFTAYRKAVGALRKLPNKVTSAKEAFAIPFIGKRLADKIEEIVWTNKLRRLENTNLEPNDKVCQLFMRIFGCGLKQATKWVDQGHRTLADLVTNASLTKNQKIGIEHFDDFQTRIPREEMDRHDHYVRKTCKKIDASLQFTIGGSYRRGAASSGDVDFIVTKPDCPIEVLRTIMLETVIPRLFEQGYLKVGLATIAKEDGSKWHGAAALPESSVWRRIDFLLVPWDELGAALIYFTGNDIFNRSIRLLASKQGMRLNQRGLWKDFIRGKNRERATQGSLVEAKDEKKIFEVLGVPWRPPHHRIC